MIDKVSQMLLLIFFQISQPTHFISKISFFMSGRMKKKTVWGDFFRNQTVTRAWWYLGKYAYKNDRTNLGASNDGIYALLT